MCFMVKPISSNGTAMGGGGGELDRLCLTRHTLSSDSLDVNTLYLDNLFIDN